MSTAIRDAALIIGVSLLGVTWMQTRSTPEPSLQVVSVEETRSKAPTRTAASLTLYKERGQFFTRGYADSGEIRFLVDTGASVVALTLADARRAGVNVNELRYTAEVSTANGRTRAAPVTIRTLSVGPITERDVEALVIEEGLDISLLGMTFLGRLQKMEAKGDTLTLTL